MYSTCILIFKMLDHSYYNYVPLRLNSNSIFATTVGLLLQDTITAVDPCTLYNIIIASLIIILSTVCT